MADSVLRTLGRKIDQEMIEPLRQQLVGRQLAYVNPFLKGDDVFEVEHHRIGELSAATVSYSLPRPDAARDSITTTRETLKVPVLDKAFEIQRADFDIWQASEGKKPLDTTVAISAAQVVGEKEDNLIINGWKPDGTNTKITGLFDGAGNSFTTSKDFGTYGNATDAVAGAFALVEDDSAAADAYNLVLNPVQRNELRASRSANGIREEPEILEMLNPKGGTTGRIISTKARAAGTGILSPVDPARRFIELVIPRDYRTTLGMDSKDEETSPIYGRVYCMTILKIKQAAGICSLTQI
jgi:uncharacterized linocin/CFP29 family protein